MIEMSFGHLGVEMPTTYDNTFLSQSGKRIISASRLPTEGKDLILSPRPGLFYQVTFERNWGADDDTLLVGDLFSHTQLPLTIEGDETLRYARETYDRVGDLLNVDEVIPVEEGTELLCFGRTSKGDTLYVTRSQQEPFITPEESVKAYLWTPLGSKITELNVSGILSYRDNTFGFRTSLGTFSIDYDTRVCTLNGEHIAPLVLSDFNILEVRCRGILTITPKSR